jgi:hypothetical protein
MSPSTSAWSGLNPSAQALACTHRWRDWGSRFRELAETGR